MPCPLLSRLSDAALCSPWHSGGLEGGLLRVLSHLLPVSRLMGAATHLYSTMIFTLNLDRNLSSLSKCPCCGFLL